jgi:HEAT repeat protein
MKAILLVLSFLVFTAAAAPALQDPPPADNRPEVKQMTDKLAAHASKRGKEDVQAKGVIDQLLQEFKNCGPKDRALVVKALDKCFNEKRQEDENGVRDNGLYICAAVALGEMAPESVPVLLHWIGDKSHRKDTELQKKLILLVGKTKHDSAREPLIALLLDKDPQLVAAAAEGLGNFAEIEQKVRKSTFEEVLKVLTSAKNAVDADANDTIARDRYDVVSAPMVTTLQRLSGQEISDPAEWQRWWNKNKKEDWDAGK